MRLFWFPIALIIGLCSVGAWSADSDTETYIYRGEPIAAVGITADSWGSGKASESVENIAPESTGSRSIKITTQGLYSGGHIDFSQPVTLFTGGIDKKRYILFTLYFAPDGVEKVDPAAGTYSNEVEPYSIPKAEILRFTFVSDNDERVSTEQVTNPLDPDDNWVRIAVPIAKFKSLEGVNEFRLKRLIITSDVGLVFYVGEIKLMTDNAPIKVLPLSSQTVAVSDEVIFVAEASGGICSLVYSWDYDDSNGIQTETTGKVGQYVYTRGGNFNVTLTVSDADNLKDPVTVKGKITVID